MSDDVRRYEVTGQYRPCPACRAPYVDPFPDEWVIELVKEGPRQGPVASFVTPHAEQCTASIADPQPGTALRLSGRFVAAAGARQAVPDDPLGRARGAVLYQAHDPEVPVAPPPASDDGWQLVGYTDGGMVSTDGVTWTPPDPGPGKAWARAVTDLREGQAVQIMMGPGETWVKPTVSYDVEGITVTASDEMRPDQVAIVSGVDPGEVLPGEPVPDAMVRLGRVVVAKFDPPEVDGGD